MSYAAQAPAAFISAQEHRAFLTQVRDDDDFRSKLLADPTGVLESYGFHLAKRDTPPHVTLPPKEVLESSLNTMDEPDRSAIARWYGLIDG